MKTFEEVKAESTCQKRIIICEIFDYDGNLLARESNRCNPEGGKCHRIGVVNGKADYPNDSQCNWTHAEINAIKSLPPGSKPYEIILYGHNFMCPSCEVALEKIGIKEIFIQPDLNNNDIISLQTNQKNEKPETNNSSLS